MAPRKSHTGSCLTINDEETLMTLRHYELNAYAAVVTALRAEGHINEKKKTILKDLRDILGISIERHKAEIRRAANDENLSNVARQIQGVPCDDDWQSEGRRIVAALQHSHPITAYTRIADEVAESLLNESNEMPFEESINTERISQEKVVHPPENPQQILNNKMFGDVFKLSEENSQPKQEEEEDVGESTNEDFLDSYVFLPGGTVVKVEPHVKQKTQSNDHVPSPQSQTKSASPKKHTAAITSTPSLHSTPPKKPSFLDDEIIDLEKPDIARDAPKRSFPFSQHTQKNSETLKQKIPKRQEQYQRPLSHQLDHLYSSGRNPRGQNLSQSLNSNWATKDTAAAEAKARRQRQRSALANARKLSRSLNASARRSSPTDRKARITGMQEGISLSQRSSLSQSKRSPPKHVNIYPKPTSTLYPGHSQHDYQYPPEDSLYEKTMLQGSNSPQKVFRPTMQMTSPPVEKSSAPSSHDLFSTSHLLRGPVESGLASVSAIMSQVSSKSQTAITPPNLPPKDQHLKISHGPPASIRRVSDDTIHTSFRSTARQKPPEFPSPKPPTASGLPGDFIDVDDELMDEPIQDTTPIPKKSIELKRTQPTTSLSMQPSTAHIAASVKPIKEAGPTPPIIDVDDESVVESIKFTAPVIAKKNIESTVSLKQAKPAISMQPSTTRITASIKSVKETVSSTIVTSVKPQLSNSTIPLSESNLNSASKVPTSVAQATTTAASAASHGTSNVMPGLSHLSSTNIIKVTPRPLVGTKVSGSQRVTQIAGARITKAFNSGGSTKPSIIVVRQAPRKTVVTAPTKVLDLEGSSITLPRLKAVSSGITQSMKPTTIIRPVSVRDGSDATASSAYEQSSGTGAHKVITKGKMRQLVLKPTSSSVLRQPSQDTPGTLPAFVSHGLSDTAMSDETSQQPTASPLQAVSTIKALAAMQKSSPVFSANSFAHGSPLNSQTPSSLP